MNIKSYIWPLTSMERIWMEEVYRQQKTGSRMDYKLIWEALHDQVGDFDPNTIDNKLLKYNGESLNILGIVAIEQSEAFLDKFDKVMRAIRKLIIVDGHHDQVIVADMVEESGIDYMDVQLVLLTMEEIGKFQGNTRHEESSWLYTSIEVTGNANFFDNYRNYTSVRQLLDARYNLVSAEQDLLAKSYMVQGKYPVVRDGKHLVELLEHFYGPYMSYDIMTHQESIRNPLTLDIAQLQLTSLNAFIQRAEASLYDDVMDNFERLPFGVPDKKEYIYYRWIHRLYENSPIWRNALYANGKVFDHINLEDHGLLIEVVGRYVIYRKYLMEWIENERAIMGYSGRVIKLRYHGVAMLHYLWNKFGENPGKKISKTNAATIAKEFNLQKGTELWKKVQELEKIDYDPGINTNRAKEFYEQYLAIVPFLQKIGGSAVDELNRRIRQLENRFPKLLQK